MSKLYFKVNADYEKVIKLREEISKLKDELKNVDVNKAPGAAKALETQLNKTSQELRSVVKDAASAANEVRGEFSKKMLAASQNVNQFTEKIIAQKGAINSLQSSIRRNKDLMRTISERGGEKDNVLINHIRQQERELLREKDALFKLTQQQAEAKLSVKKLNDEYKALNQTTEKTARSSVDLMKSLMKMSGLFLGGMGVKEFLSQMVAVRGAFQSMEVSMRTLLGSEEKAAKLMGELKQFARISPLDLKSIASASQTLLGFNVEAEKVPKFLRAIGDISMGDAGRFQSLALAFSQMSAAGKLMGQDLLQMINAGFNPLQTMSEKTGKSISQLKEEMSKGAISAKDVQQAFLDAASAGGKFYHMSENASKTINGQLSMMRDAMDAAFNEMGEKSEGAIMKGVELTTTLIKNYETVGKVIAGLVITYGTYRAAVLTNIVLTEGWAAATAKDTVAKGINTVATKAQTVAQIALNNAMKANPYVLLASAVVGLGMAMWALKDNTTAAEKALKDYNEEKDRAIKAEKEHKQEIDKLIDSSRDLSLADIERGRSLSELRKEYPKIFEKYDIETIKLADILQLKKQIAEEDAKRANNKLNTQISTKEEELRALEMELSAKEINGGKLSEREKYKRDYLREQLHLIMEEKGHSISEKFISELKNLDNTTLDKYLNELKRRISGNKDNDFVAMKLPIGKDGVLSDRAGYRTKDIKAMIDKINAIQKERLDAVKNRKSYKQDYEQAKKEWELAKKKLIAIENDKSKFTTEQYNKAKAEKEAAEKRFKELGGGDKSHVAAVKAEGEDIIQMRRKNLQTEIDLLDNGSQKRIRQINLDYQNEMEEIKRLEKKLGDTISEEKKAEIDKARSLAKQKRDSRLESFYREDLEFMRQYLEQYGTMEQKKYAITQEYDEKIRKAETDTQKFLLEKEKKQKLNNLKTEAVQQDINWNAVFSDFGGMFSDLLKDALKQAKEYMKTDEFAQSDAASKQALIEAIHRMESVLSGGGLPFAKLGADMKAFDGAMKNLLDAKEREKESIEKMSQAQKEYQKALKEGTDTEKAAAKEKLDAATIEAEKSSTEVRKAGENLKSAQNTVVDTANTLNTSMKNITSGLSELKSGSLSSVFNGLINVSKGLGGSFSKLAEKLEDVPIVGWVIGLIDIFKDGMSKLFGDIIDTVMSAVSGIIKDVLSLDVLKTIGKSLYEGTKNIWNALTFGYASKLADKINGSNAKEVNDTTNRLTSTNKVLIKSIDSLKDQMKRAKGMETVNAYKNATDKQRTLIENTRKILAAQMNYHSAHHSNNYYLDKEMNGEDWDAVSQKVGKNVRSAKDLWKLSPEELKKIQQLTMVWEKISTAGRYDKSKYLDEYIGLADSIGKLTEDMKTTLTGITFDSMYDNFRSRLMDMKYDAKSASEDVAKMFMEAMVNNFVGEKFEGRLKAFRDKMAEKMEAGGGLLDEKSIGELSDEYENIVKDAIKERDLIAKITGYSDLDASAQSGSTKGFAAMSQDTAEELNGRFTALQISNEGILSESRLTNQYLGSIKDAIANTPDLADKNRQTIVSSYQSNVSMKYPTDGIRDMKNTMVEMRATLQGVERQLADMNLESRSISENTRVVAKNVPQIIDNTENIKRNTSKL